MTPLLDYLFRLYYHEDFTYFSYIKVTGSLSLCLSNRLTDMVLGRYIAILREIENQEKSQKIKKNVSQDGATNRFSLPTLVPLFFLFSIECGGNFPHPPTHHTPGAPRGV